jgi:hypothetical protein
LQEEGFRVEGFELNCRPSSLKTH